MRTKTIAANWKANSSLSDSKSLIEGILQGSWREDRRVVIAVPDVYLSSVSSLISSSPIGLAAQDCSSFPNGAYTGETTVQMLKDLGVEYVILGHSERRQYFNEDSDLLLKKLQISTEAGLKPIFCVGESLEERKSGRHVETVISQLEVLKDLGSFDPSKVLIAYEPVWAIGTGETASPEQAEEMHDSIRKWLTSSIGAEEAEATVILYGGSVKAANAASIFDMENIDGGLVGGASLDPDEFLKIINS
jgi:triosephosphate isomerase